MVDIQGIAKDIDDVVSVGDAIAIDIPEHCKAAFDSSAKTFSVLHQNIRSLNRNYDGLTVLLKRLNINYDLIVLTESWLSENSVIPEMVGYTTHSTKSHHNQNDGIVLYLKDNIHANVYEPNFCHEVNCLVTTINNNVAVVSLYRPPAFKNLDPFLKSLDKILSNINHYNNIILMGDLNINIKPEKLNPKQTEYLNLLASYGLLSSHTLPTRESNCLDHCFVKTKLKPLTIVCNSTLTDHSSVMISLNLKIKNRPKQNHFRTKTDYDAAINDLKMINWEERFHNDDPNAMTNIFLNTIKDILLFHTNTVKQTRRQIIIKPWITPGLCRCMRNRDQLHQKLRKDPDNSTLAITYKRYRNKCNSLLRSLKNNYFKSELAKSGNNIKKQWGLVKEMANLNSFPKVSSELLSTNLTPQEALNNINRHFVNVGSSLANTILSRTCTSEIELSKRHRPGPNSEPLNSFVLLPTDPIEIKEIITNFKSKNSSGWDGISTIFIKRAAHALIAPLTRICNVCFSKGVFPDALKKSVVVPIYKAGDKTLASNYRPISLLPSFSKILEKLINKRLKHYLETYKLLSDNQFGFREKISTADALHKLTSYLVENMDKGQKSLGIFLDLAKAFDTVSVPILLTKLEALGIRGIPLQLFQDYLTNRKQVIKIDNSVSLEENVTFGVPQGSVMGPTLFLIYINDLCNLLLRNGQIITFADDTVLLFSSNTWKDVTEAANEGFALVTSWLDNHLLTLNLDKTKFVTFTLNARTQPSTNSTIIQSHNCNNTNSCHCNPITRVKSIKYLGVIVDQNLSWKEHVMKVGNRARKLIYIFKSIRNACDIKLLIKIYLALCQSILTYGLNVWGGTSKTTMLIVERAQRMVLKVISRKKYTYPTDVLYSELGVLTVRKLFIKQEIMTQHKVRPHYTKRRRVDIVYNVPKYRTSFAHKFHNYLGPHLYNTVSKDLKLMNLDRQTCKDTLEKYLKSLDYNNTENLLERMT
ncbi:hypothetical protein PYW08_013718 [Mythimna loreyi]|uniref:Uncharacterized protein n=1 Tax=Mythimna loreyi TaxID=667449 RepID=A0ACC2R6R6_9NEOP|nr:hypothetical protein PYW08_013718 [Mythimna loreyi]